MDFIGFKSRTRKQNMYSSASDVDGHTIVGNHNVLGNNIFKLFMAFYNEKSSFASGQHGLLLNDIVKHFETVYWHSFSSYRFVYVK